VVDVVVDVDDDSLVADPWEHYRSEADPTSGGV
jgi:hypothetical protein